MMFSKKYSFSRGNRYKCRCVQKPKAKPNVGGCTDDAGAVAVLPDHWVPRAGGPILADYLRGRQEKHIRALKNLKTDTELVNENIESKIRALAERLLCHIKHNQCDIDCVIREFTIVEITLPCDIYNVALNNIDRLISARIQDLREFKERALNVEKDRADGLKKVFHDNFRSIIAIGHVSPKDLLKRFDDKTYDMNQQLLSNCSAYRELEKQLCLQAEQSKRRARSLINQLRLGAAETRRGGSARCSDSDEPVARKRPRSANMKVDIIHVVSNEKPSTKDLKVLVSSLTDEYRIAIADLYKVFFDDFNDLYNRVGNLNNVEKDLSSGNVTSVLDQNLTGSITRLSNFSFHSAICSNENLFECTDYIDTIKNSLKSTANQLKSTYILLHEASHLWDAHMIRVALAQKLTLAAVEELVSRHDSMELANEVTFNITLEQMLTASDVVRLNQYYDVLIIFLQEKTEQYIQHSNAEVERLNDFINLHAPLKNTILAEFVLFMSKHPIPTFVLINKVKTSQDSRLDISSSNLNDALSREIYQTEMQMVALSNWRNGFLEKFENRLSSLSEKLEHQIRLWVSERSVPLLKRRSAKMTSLDVRMERVIRARRLRLARLLQQEACLESHLKAVNEVINIFPAQVAGNLTMDTTDWYPISRWVDGIAKGIAALTAFEVNEEVKWLRMMSYAARLTKHRALFEESLVPAFESAKRAIENRFQATRISNFQYMSSLKMIFEGGQEPASKAMEICAHLVNKGNALEASFSKVSDVLLERRNEINVQVDTMVVPLQTAAEETTRDKMKGDINKNKQQRKKK